MIQKSMQSFESACGKAKIYVESDMPIGVFHDFLMQMKGAMVDRMVAAHKEEVGVLEAQKQASCSDQCGTDQDCATSE